MNTKKINTPFDELTYNIIGCAMEIHRKRGPGFRERTYQKDLESHFCNRSIAFESQKFYEVLDTINKTEIIGFYVPDFVVDGKVILEIKAIKEIQDKHYAQVIGYLAVSGLSLGLLINFGTSSLVYKRILPPKSVSLHRVNRQWLYVPEWLKKGA